MWSPPDCTNTCEPCINGGVCSDLTGLCLCPPGFSGNNCENMKQTADSERYYRFKYLRLCQTRFAGENDSHSGVHGRNVFGQNAEYKCDDSGDDHADGCQGAIICYPDPLGCFCPAGYKGLNCTEECETGTFGANCKQECHCADNTLCALDTGGVKTTNARMAGEEQTVNVVFSLCHYCYMLVNEQLLEHGFICIDG
ncbi:putative receptor-type tyrosine-protein phosphatase F isoform X1 [Apostichopus japonicus]|uniref:Putative receptor-type tyrosine-protein phosphatase F isoform X1 n=1 Tax=Stichopus japonicus TaxID=307972 RepID=A0A2G8KFS8_STIJA|nr:putative receptor-type tyrosine-protein phosphatase F isoform X1 [Apostichopus japonicus]